MNSLLKTSAVHNKLLLILFLSITSSLYGKLPALSKSLTKIVKPYDAPALKLLDIDDEVVDLKTLKGKVVIINFWATWCPPCRREMPSLQKLYNKVSNKNVVVLAVDVGESADKVDDYLSNISPEVTFQALLDTKSETMVRWKVRGLPSTFIVNKKGKVVYKAIGGREFDSDGIIKQINDLLK